MYMHVKAFEYMIKAILPCNVKFMIEGEEVGSVNLKPSLKTILKKNLKMILISDTGMISNQQPSITTGLRGLSYVK
jgi:acetylornithine deacetylase/succinyl-diaminopimelate desuccinylase-like protein